MKKLKLSNDTDDVYSILDSTLFSKTKKKSLYDGFKKNKTINEVLDKPTPKPMLAGLNHVPFGKLLRPADIAVLELNRAISRFPALFSPEGGRTSAGPT